MKIQLKDQLGRMLNFEQSPQKIVSLVPSISELLWDMNLQDELVGVTKFCIHPKDLRAEKAIVGGTKNVKIERLMALQPDFVIANLEENTKDEIEAISKLVPTYISDINSIEEMRAFILDMGKICNRELESKSILKKVKETMDGIIPFHPIRTALYLIWNDPFMSIGNDTFINHMMEKVGYTNCLSNKTRYPVLTESDILELNPSEILLSSEPFPFKENHQIEIQKKFPNSKVKLVDGEAFSWYGSRIFKVKEYLASFK
jgi:ABC-type Fe3+-hydroxamate transport system substrate-binding protein